MKTVAARQNIVVTAQDSVSVTAIASDGKATVSGSKGTLALNPGANSFRVTVTAEDGSKAYFNFTITVNEPEPTPTPKPTQEPHSHSYAWKYNIDSHWRECDCGSTTGEGSHSFDDPSNCVSCDDCGYMFHITEPKYDDTHHWQECATHSIREYVEEHVFDSGSGSGCSGCSYAPAVDPGVDETPAP